MSTIFTAFCISQARPESWPLSSISIHTPIKLFGVLIASSWRCTTFVLAQFVLHGIDDLVNIELLETLLDLFSDTVTTLHLGFINPFSLPSLYWNKSTATTVFNASIMQYENHIPA
jgi:hypothetical protein